MLNLERWFDRHAEDAARMGEGKNALALFCEVLWWRCADEQTNYWIEGGR
jgi:hypothetical protein